MPITFGSVGDIISVCLLVKDLVDALDKARGSKAEYQSLIRELWILDRSLLEIDLLARTHGGGATPELEALCETARKAVDRCRDLVSSFSKRVQKYQKSLGENETPNFIQATTMKVRWCIGEKDAVDKFRAEIAATSASLQMLLATASVKLIDINGRNMKDYMTTVKQQNTSNLNKHDAILISINDRLEDTNRLITSGNSTMTKIADTLRLDWLRQLGTELKGYMRRIVAMNVATYHAVISLQSALPNRLERGLIEEPFILEDAIGRIAPVHLQFVTSWDAFNAVLEIRFQRMQGSKKVKQRQYELQDKATKRDIEQSRPWERAFLPGQRIEMSFLFDTQDNNESGSRDVTCPGCQTISANPTDAEIQCENCRMWFRRITIVQDVEPPPQVPVPSPWRSRSKFGRPGFAGMVSGPVRPGKKRVAPADVDGEDDLREFKRVRLVIRKERTKLQAFEKKKGSQTFKTFSTLSTTKSESSTNTWDFNARDQTRSSQVPRPGSTDKHEIPKWSAADQSFGQVEVMKVELLKARENGSLSKVSRGSFSNDNERTETEVTKMDVDPATPEKETFWNPKWFPPQIPDTFYRPKLPEMEPDIPSEGNISRDEVPLPSAAEWPVTPEFEDGTILDPSRVTYFCLSSPILQQYAQPFYHVDPAHLTYEQLRIAKRYFESPQGADDLNRPQDTLWPVCSLTTYVSTNEVLDPFKLDCSLIATADSPYGTPFRLPFTETVFYGASIGRWIFDWTCHLIFEEAIVLKALRLWDSIYTLERNLFMLVHSHYGLSKNESKGIWGISEEADMYFCHFIVCYRYFWWHLFSSMSTIRMPNGQGFGGDTPPSVEAYAKAFLKRFFFVTPWGVDGRHKKALLILDHCATYLAAGIGELVDLREKKAETSENMGFENEESRK